MRQAGRLDQSMIGQPVFSADGKQLGTVKEVQGSAFKVDAPMKQDYWLPDDAIRSMSGGQLTVGFDQSHLDDYKLSGPDMVDTGRGTMTDFKAQTSGTMTDTLADTGQLVGYELVGSGGDRIGTVDSLWLDEATSRPEFIGVADRRNAERLHLVPVVGLQADGTRHTLRVPYDADRIQGAPVYDRSADLTAQDEDRIYGYYGIDRSTAPSPTGLPGHAGRMWERAERPRAGMTTEQAQGRRVIPLREEQLRVQKQPTEAGEVGIRKQVVTEQKTIDVPVSREEVVVERHPVEPRPADRPIGSENEEIRVPVREEHVNVEKQPVVTGEVEVGKREIQDTERVSGEVRHEEARIEREGDVRVQGPTPEDREHREPRR
jgi:uncharacterized protein (TIGR02271 family)